MVNADGRLDIPARTDLKPNKAYIFEIDLEYPANIHDRDDDYLLAPELLEIKTEMLSEKQLRVRRLYYDDSEPFSRKLVCSLLPKHTTFCSVRGSSFTRSAALRSRKCTGPFALR